MDYSIKKRKPSALEITITFDENDQSEYRKKALKNISKEVSVKGFRKGKAPEDKVIAKVGEAYVLSQTLDMAMNTSFYEIMVKEKFRPVTGPKADLKSDKPLKVILHVDVFPELPKFDMKKIKIKAPKISVSEKEKKEAMTKIREGKREWEKVDRKAKKGDRIEIDFEGFINGEPFAGGKSKNHPLVIGSNSFIPGFEDQCIGLVSGDKKDLNITFPTDYGHKEFAGKKATFQIFVHEVSAEKLPDISDEFAADITQGECKTIAELEQKIEEIILDQKNKEAEEDIQKQIVNQIIKHHPLEIPQSLIEEESQYITSMLKKDLEKNNMNLDAYLQMRKINQEAYEKEAHEEAQKRLTLRFALQSLSEEQKLDASKSEIDEALKKMNDSSHGDEKLLREHLAVQIKMQKAFDLIRSSVQ